MLRSSSSHLHGASWLESWSLTNLSFCKLLTWVMALEYALRVITDLKFRGKLVAQPPSILLLVIHVSFLIIFLTFLFFVCFFIFAASESAAILHKNVILLLLLMAILLFFNRLLDKWLWSFFNNFRVFVCPNCSILIQIYFIPLSIKFNARIASYRSDCFETRAEITHSEVCSSDWTVILFLFIFIFGKENSFVIIQILGHLQIDYF